jgi:uncharacterized tellurite resistance protein B-like protein
MSNKNELIADLLMGAAYADDQLDGREVDTVLSCLAKVMNVDEDALPGEITDRIGVFEPGGFDPVTAVAALGLQDDGEKRNLIELIAAVTDADETFDLDENTYVETVAQALGLAKEAYGDLTVEILSVENLQAVGKKLIEPPPLPPDAD